MCNAHEAAQTAPIVRLGCRLGHFRLDVTAKTARLAPIAKLGCRLAHPRSSIRVRLSARKHPAHLTVSGRFGRKLTYAVKLSLCSTAIRRGNVLHLFLVRARFASAPLLSGWEYARLYRHLHAITWARDPGRCADMGHGSSPCGPAAPGREECRWRTKSGD